ncbi:hypothetical protein D805_1098 [Bifidobacterium thermophilum RBL67]|uniref:Uncharacterized protein n=1 Tax=Bifidobacterium thermophilum RBL67 TaxID=1254439 RepID=M4RD07_9BIFI|nr:hypothetical protein D805_1098 [Bifidobacterium thermophilum RBL67]
MEFQTLSASAPNRRIPRTKRDFLRIAVNLGGWYVVSSHAFQPGCRRLIRRHQAANTVR